MLSAILSLPNYLPLLLGTRNWHKKTLTLSWAAYPCTSHNMRIRGKNLLQFWLFWKQSKFFMETTNLRVLNAESLFTLYIKHHNHVSIQLKPNHAAEGLWEKKIKCFHHWNDWHLSLIQGQVASVPSQGRCTRLSRRPSHEPHLGASGPDQVTLNSKG